MKKLTKSKTVEMVKMQSKMLPYGLTLREWLGMVRLEIKAFASLLEISEFYVHQILRGEKNPSKKLDDKIFDLSMHKVYYLNDSKRKAR